MLIHSATVVHVAGRTSLTVRATTVIEEDMLSHAREMMEGAAVQIVGLTTPSGWLCLVAVVRQNRVVTPKASHNCIGFVVSLVPG